MIKGTARPSGGKKQPDLFDTLGSAAAQAQAAGVAVAPIVFSAIGPSVAVLAAKLGNEEVAEALNQLALLIDQATLYHRPNHDDNKTPRRTKYSSSCLN